MVVKLVVLYPPPDNVEAFEEQYVDDIVPFLRQCLPGMTRCVLSKALWALAGEPPYYLLAEIYFPSLEALQAAVSPPVFQTIAAQPLAPTTSIPVAFVCTEEVAMPIQDKPLDGTAE